LNRLVGGWGDGGVALLFTSTRREQVDARGGESAPAMSKVGPQNARGCSNGDNGQKWLSDDGVANALGRGRINEAGKGWLGLDGKRASGAA